jgi:hypothetical protein
MALLAKIAHSRDNFWQGEFHLHAYCSRRIAFFHGDALNSLGIAI